MSTLGLPRFSQAARMLGVQWNKSIRGNTFIEFETGLRSIGLTPGDLITVSYAREGLDRSPFRVVKIAPGLHYSGSLITAQIHDDSWYTGAGDGSLGVVGGGRQRGCGVVLPRALICHRIGVS